MELICKKKFLGRLISCLVSLHAMQYSWLENKCDFSPLSKSDLEESCYGIESTSTYPCPATGHAFVCVCVCVREYLKEMKKSEAVDTCLTWLRLE